MIPEELQTPRMTSKHHSERLALILKPRRASGND